MRNTCRMNSRLVGFFSRNRVLDAVLPNYSRGKRDLSPSFWVLLFLVALSAATRLLGATLDATLNPGLTVCLYSTLSLTVTLTPDEDNLAYSVSVKDPLGNELSSASLSSTNPTMSYTITTNATDAGSIRVVCTDLSFDSTYDWAVVGLVGITQDRYYAVNGGTVTFTGVSAPDGYAFPTNAPTWSATTGTNDPTVGGSTTWTAPSSFSDNSTTATITANGCGGDSFTASVTPIQFITTGPVGPTIEGTDSGDFTITSLTPVEGLSYSWGATWPTNSGNDPSADFASPSSAVTKITKAHWFASPSNRLATVAGTMCMYTIWGCVSYGGGIASNSTTWTVWVKTPNSTIPRMFTMDEGYWPAIGVTLVGGQTIYYVLGKKTLGRTIATANKNGLPDSSQFYDKAFNVHEGKHVEQWESEWPWSSLQNPDVFCAGSLTNSGINGMWDTDSLRLNSRIASAMSSWLSADDAYALASYQYRQDEALGMSNAAGPHFLEEDPVGNSLPPPPPER